MKGTLRICKNGHKFYKSSDCPTCPICEELKKPAGGFLSLLSAPARRALEGKGISTLKKLSTFSSEEIKSLHGMGPNAVAKLELSLKEDGLAFKKAANKILKKEITKTKKDSTKESDHDSVDAWIKKTKYPMMNVVTELRSFLLKCDKNIGEEIKWNAPTFFYSGKMKDSDPKEYARYIIVMNLFKKDCLRLVFPSGARINDKSGFLEGDYKDGRRLAYIYSLEDLKKKGRILKNCVKDWIKVIDK